MICRLKYLKLSLALLSILLLIIVKTLYSDFLGKFGDYTFILFILFLINNSFHNLIKQQLKIFDIEYKISIPTKMLLNFSLFYVAFLSITYFPLQQILSDITHEDYVQNFLKYALMFYLLFFAIIISESYENQIIIGTDKIFISANYIKCELPKNKIKEICHGEYFISVLLKNGEKHKISITETYLRKRGKEKQLKRLKKLIKEIEKQWQISVPDCT